jgi:hypothetical protein
MDKGGIRVGVDYVFCEPPRAGVPIQRVRILERLVWDAIYSLQKAGLDKEADRLRRAVQRT